MWFLVIDKPVAIFSLEHNFTQVYILPLCNDTLHSPMCKILWIFLFILTWTYLHPLPFRRHFHSQEYFTMKQESRMLACLKKMQVIQFKKMYIPSIYMLCCLCLSVGYIGLAALTLPQKYVQINKEIKQVSSFQVKMFSQCFSQLTILTDILNFKNGTETPLKQQSFSLLSSAVNKRQETIQWSLQCR